MTVKRARMNGGQLQDAIVDLAHVLGYLAHHQRPARTKQGWRSTVQYDGKGFPDLVLAGPRGVLFIEVKGDGDRLRPDQQAWIETLTAGGALVWIVTPDDWLSGAVERLLKRGTRDA